MILKNKKTGHTSLQMDWSMQIDWSKERGKGVGENQFWSKNGFGKKKVGRSRCLNKRWSQSEKSLFCV